MTLERLSAGGLIGRCAYLLSWLQTLHAGDLVTWDPNGNGYYITPANKWFVEAGRYDEKNAGGGLGQWDRDHHYDVWGKVRVSVCSYCVRACETA